MLSARSSGNYSTNAHAFSLGRQRDIHTLNLFQYFTISEENLVAIYNNVQQLTGNYTGTKQDQMSSSLFLDLYECTDPVSV